MPPIQAPKSIQRPTAFQYFGRTADLYMIAAFTTLDVSYWPMADPPCRPGAGPLIEVHRLRAMQAIDVVGAPAYDPEQTRPSCSVRVIAPGPANCWC
jgi:hypothetical protein